MNKHPMSKDEIKLALMAKGFRPVDIAKMTGVSRSMVCHVMAGRHPDSPVRTVISIVIKKPVSKIWPLSSCHNC